ncbi:MAG: hypothetical protein DWQ37_09275 [Planctomycetota bacterium]|nr:MAG: hypothetical protein DWQ37_09275 [Planctomycetota bacterium]
MNLKNRLAGPRADYLLLIVQRPRGWTPQKPDEIPPDSEVLAVHHVASIDEARDDMYRCNRLALRHNLPRWAVVQSGGGDL